MDTDETPKAIEFGRFRILPLSRELLVEGRVDDDRVGRDPARCPPDESNEREDEPSGNRDSSYS